MAEIEKISLKEQVALLPMSAGCYLFENSKGEVIYVGKAKHLRNRVRSYFVESRDHSAKVRVMVRQIASMRHIVVYSETDALLLENSLIKTLQPRYNILLKDDKSYPWIAVTAEQFPRILSTRQLVRDGSQYYGPYGSISAQRAVLDFIREALPLRICRQNMTEESVARAKHAPCLQYHLGNCKAPCVGRCSREEYRGYIDIATSVLKGDLRPVRTYLEGEMMRAAEELRFEVAARYKARLDALERYAARSVIVSANMGDMDIFSLLVDDDEAYCNFLRVRNGSITAVHTATIAVGVESDECDIMTLGIQHIKENIAGAISLSGNTITALAEGTATITATVAEGATYLSNSVDFTVTVNPQNIATLPFAFDGGVSQIATTLGMSQKNLGKDYDNSPKLKFDDKDDYVIIHFDERPGKLTYDIKANTGSGAFSGEFAVQESADGVTYRDLVKYSTISGIPVGTVAIVCIASGFILSFIFSNYEGSIIKSILSSLTNIVSVLLGVVNVFSDIVSYIRLWAVGIAGAAISATVNELAGPLLGNFMFMILAIVLLVFGHGLNMILNILSVIVHGIRLNTLEFSSHLDMSWSGHKFKPFKEQID